ncbi:MAG: LysM peptidoglycan-binding domain-containing protein [Thermoanaerobaculia bacterium]
MTCSATAGRRNLRALLRKLLVVLGLGLVGAGAASAAPLAETAASAAPVDKSDWESGWHVVRPGDTLEGLAERYLGTHEHWHELHLLNPFVKDPNLLFPGQRLRIFLERPTAKLSAQIMAVASDVRELPTPVPWRPASAGDVLLERDALRTAKSASARLRFDDGASVTLSEDSLVFIRRQTAATSPLPRKEIEIQLGQIDVDGAVTGSADTPARAKSGGGRGRTSPDAIEVVVAGARSLTTPEPGQPLSTRSRKSTGDGAQFMVFAGKSTVSAAGASIEVPAGSGTSVAARAKPGPVEVLLPAPADPRPAPDEEIEQGAPEFSWAAVPGADHYTVEICRDPACGALVARAPIVPAASLQLEVAGGLPAGELFWRVTAVAASGLDGYPTAPIRVVAVETARPEAPLLALRTATGETVPAEGCVGVLPEPVVHAVDRRGSELPWTLVLDGRELSVAEFRSQPLSGRHELAARVRDARGRTADSASLTFTLDAAAPWAELLVTSAAPTPATSATPEPSGKQPRSRSRRHAQEPMPAAACDSGLEFRDGSGNWTLVPCSTGVAPAPAVVALDPTRPGVTLRATRAVFFGDRSGEESDDDLIGAGESPNLATWDVGCGATQLAVRIVPSPYRPGRMLLEAEVTDGAGNRRTLGWHIARN